MSWPNDVVHHSDRMVYLGMFHKSYEIHSGAVVCNQIPNSSHVLIWTAAEKVQITSREYGNAG